jgi:hypothetical protein
MTAREKADDLILRYVREVGRSLPRAMRDDVEAELRTLLDEALDERARAAGRPPDEELAAGVLRAFGPPDKVAQRYEPEPRYLIGPRLFPAFLATVKVMLVFVAGFLLFWYFVGFAASERVAERLPDFLQAQNLGRLFGNFVRIALVNLGLVVAVFAAIEYYLRQRRAEEEKQEWNPLDLPKVEDPDRISPGGLVVKIYIIVALFAVLNFFPEYFGVLIITGDQVRAIPYHVFGLKLPLLFLNVWWALALALNVWLLREGRWTRESRWAEFGLGLFGALILFLILAGSSSAAADPEWVLDRYPDLPARLGALLGRVLPVAFGAIRVALTVALVMALVEALVRLYRLLTRYAPAR